MALDIDSLAAKRDLVSQNYNASKSELLQLKDLIKSKREQMTVLHGALMQLNELIEENSE